MSPPNRAREPKPPPARSAGRTPGVAPSTSPATAGIFVGRERESALLDARLERARQGNGGVVLVVGDAGIGKTRIARELAATALQRGVRVVWGLCNELEGAPAYWPWIQILRTLVRDSTTESLRSWLGAEAPLVADLVPEVRERLPDVPRAPLDLSAEEARFRFLDGLTLALRRSARNAPLLVIVEDLHWADAASIMLFHFLAEHVLQAPLLLVGTYRDVELRMSSGLQDVRESLGRIRERIALSGLVRDEVELLTRSLLGREPEAELADGIFRATGGNPFFVDEVVRLLLAAGDAGSISAKGLQTLGTPVGVREVIRRRLLALAPEEREILALASVIGRDISVPLLLRASGRSFERALEALDAAANLGIVRPGAHATAWSFTHALMRETIYDDVAQLERMRLHRSVGDALEEALATGAPEPLEELARHFFHAAALGTRDKAVHYARRAAEQARRRLGYEDAVWQYRRALELLDGDVATSPRERCEVLLALGDAEMRAGGGARGREALVRAAVVARRAGLPDQLARAALGHGAGLGGFWDREAGMPDPDRISLIEEALAAIGDGDTAVRAQLLSRLATALYWYPAPERRAEIGPLTREALDLARRIADPAVTLEVTAGWHWADWRPDNAAERLAAADSMLEISEKLGQQESLLLGRLLRIADLLELGDIAAADLELGVFERQATDLRQVRYRWWVHLFRASRAVFDGRFAEAEVHNRDLLGADRWMDDATTEHFYAAQNQALSSQQGRPPGEDLERVRLFAESYPTLPIWRCTLSQRLLALGDEAGARRELDRVAAHDFGDLPRDYTWLSAMSMLALLATNLHDTRRAALLYDLLLPYAARNVTASIGVILDGSAARYLGLLATMLERFDEATSHFEAALVANERMGARPLLAQTRYELARMLLGRGRTDDLPRAEELLAGAYGIASELGQRTLCDAIDLLRAAARERRQDGPADAGEVAAAPALEERGTEACALRRDGDAWAFAHRGNAFRLKGVKGVDYLVALLREPGRDVHVLELVGTLAPEARDALTNAAERARVNVVRAVGRALRRIAAEDLHLGQYLAMTVRTGLHCRYTPADRSPIEFTF